MRRQALSKSEISNLSAEDLAAYFSNEEMKAQAAICGMGFGKPGKLETESVGQYRQRCREAAETDKEEIGTALRSSLEQALWKKQRGHRFADAMNKFSPEEREQLEKNEAERQRRDALADREMGGSGVRPKGYPSGLTRE